MSLARRHRRALTENELEHPMGSMPPAAAAAAATRAPFTAELSQRTVQMLTTHVHCSASEVEQWHRRFVAMAPDGKLKRGDFERIYTRAFPGFDSKALADLIYAYFDADNSGYVNFSEFFVPNILFGRMGGGNQAADPEQRARAVFHIIDSSDNRSISAKELRKALEALFKFRGLVAQEPGMDAKSKAKQMMAMMDYDGDHKINEQEFVYALTRHPDLRGILEFDYSTPMPQSTTGRQ